MTGGMQPPQNPSATGRREFDERFSVGHDEPQSWANIAPREDDWFCALPNLVALCNLAKELHKRTAGTISCLFAHSAVTKTEQVCQGPSIEFEVYLHRSNALGNGKLSQKLI